MSGPTLQGRTARPDTGDARAGDRAGSGARAAVSPPVLAGVAADVARRLGVDPVAVRLAFVVLCAAGGAGVLIYAVLWLRLVRDGSARRPAAGAPLEPAGQVGLVIAFAGVLLLLRTVGLWFGDALVVPVLLGAVGSLLIWTRGDSADRARLGGVLRLPAPIAGLVDDAGRTLRRSGALAGPGPAASPGRIAAGVALVALAMLALVAANDALVAVRELAVAVLAAVIGLGLLFGPWALRLVDVARAERRARIREEERGEIAAHLHDSVLQTLALIQRSGDDAQRMAALARRQERELRRWLFEGRTAEDASSLSGALEAAVATLEASHGISVELVRVGDVALTPAVAALVAAVREAVGNAARHAGVADVAVFVEVAEDEVVAFVRDRGRGFDPAAVADDRSGIRNSVRGRLERRGGRAELTTAPGEGCEWELAVPLGDVSGDAGDVPGDVSGDAADTARDEERDDA